MKFKVNIKARLERHARNSHVFQKNKLLKIITTFKVLSVCLIFLLPIYPSFGAYSGVTESTVGEYDESSILVAYEENGAGEDTFLSDDSGFLRPGVNLGSSRDTKGLNQLIPYQVENGDSYSVIADKFNISTSSILWANGFTKNSVLKPGQTIKIPPVSGLVYTVQAGETLKSLSEKFKVEDIKIASQNKITVSTELLLGQSLIIPGAIRINQVEKDIVAVKDGVKVPSTKSAIAKKTPVQKAAEATTKKKGIPGKDSYLVKYNGKAKGFVWGNCTYYVATHKNVTWRGNANAWLRNAEAAGVKTGWKPAVGAIISLGGRGYNPYYGHVGIVVDIDGDTIIVKDMNYRKLNEVTVRKISSTDASIRGYIYVD